MDNVKNINKKKFRCNNCGNQFISDFLVEKCLFCGCLVTEMENDRIYNSFYIKPFIKTEEDAIKDYKKYVFFNPLIPLKFKNKCSVSKIYLSSSVNEYCVTGNIKFLATDNDNKKHEVLNTVNFNYKNILNCNNIKLNWLFETIIDNYENIEKYSETYLKGSIIIEGNSDFLESSNKLSKCIINATLDFIKNNVTYKYKKIVKNDLKILNYKNFNVLLPFYLINVNYKGNNYLYIMNGFNGKSVFDGTCGKLEVIIFSVILFVFIFFIGFLIAYLF